MENNTPAYPAVIMPREDFVMKLDINTIHNECGRCYVQRRRGDYSAELEDYPDFLSPRTFGDHLPGMSVNLMGGLFEPEHVCFEPNDIVEWDENATLLDASDVKFAYRSNNKGVYIDTSVNGKIFPAPREFAQKEDMIKVKNSLANVLTGFVKKQMYDVLYQIKVRHAPSVQNYWHWQVELNPLGYDTAVVMKDKAQWQKELFRVFINYIMPFATLTVPNFASISDKVYLRS